MSYRHLHHSSRRRFHHSTSDSPDLTLAGPQTFARMLGERIRLYRQRDGRPIEQLAPLAGLSVKEWETIEAGEAPESFETIEQIYHAVDAGLIIGELDYLQYLFGGAHIDYEGLDLRPAAGSFRVR